jgi:molecular chaperone GrpE
MMQQNGHDAMEPDDSDKENVAPPTSADGEVARLRAALADAERRLRDAEARADEEHNRAEGYVALLKRERADFTNYRRRVEQERAEQAQAAAADLIRQLLPALDALERALRAVPTELAGNQWVEGIRLIDRVLRGTLEGAGLERISAEGQPFDPQVHEALLQEDAPERTPGVVVRELRPGYRLGNRVLRPAQVSVARGGPPPAPRRRTRRWHTPEPPSNGDLTVL